MRELYPYYERELSFMRDMSAEFARNYPESASRLDIERHRCEDPHVERLIEGFCLIAARIHHRLDAEFPEITQALLNLIFPDYLRPVPSMSIAQFRVADDSQVSEPGGIIIPVGETLRVGEFCQFRTSYPTEIWPISVEEAAVLEAGDLPAWAMNTGAAAAILVKVTCKAGFRQLEGLRKLRFYLTGTAHIPYSLYELIFNNCYRIVARDPDNPRARAVELPSSYLMPVGFGIEDAVLPYDSRSFLGFRCLHEYLSFPDKFLFVDLDGMEELRAGVQNQAEILLLLEKPPHQERFQRLRFAVAADNFQLHCTPVINLFSKLAEPIRANQLKAEHRIIPDAYRPSWTEVYSIDSVSARSFASRSTRIYRPFFSLDHAENGTSSEAFWHAVRRRSDQKGDSGTEIDLSLVDSEFRPTKPPDDTLLVRVTCTNRDLPAELALRFEYKELTYPDSRVEARLVQRPTQSLRPPLERNLDWRIISHLGLNYLSLVGLGDSDSDPRSAQPLREILQLYNFTDDPAIRQRIGAIRSVRSQPSRARVRMRRGHDVVPVFCHGVSVTIDLDEEPFQASGLYVFACVLEQFLALYTSVNSFTQMTATIKDRKRILKQWPPRSGEHILL